MDPELTSLLKQNLAVSRETNEILKNMHSAAKWGRFFRVVYWLIIIGLSAGVYYYLKTPLENLMGVYSGALDTIQKGANGLPDVGALKAIFEKFGQ